MKANWCVLLLLATAAGCSLFPDIPVVHPEEPLPSQELSEQPPANHARVIFFNTSNRLLYGPDGTDRINVFVDGAPIGSIRIDNYLQVFLPLGRRRLTLEHRDIHDFRDDYRLLIDGRLLLVEVYCRPFSTRYKVVHTLPSDFQERFRSPPSDAR
jgi:hypothetical protein